MADCWHVRGTMSRDECGSDLDAAPTAWSLRDKLPISLFVEATQGVAFGARTTDRDAREPVVGASGSDVLGGW